MFLKKLASRLKAHRDGGGPSVRVAAFGKHPGWNDHIDDIGLTSDLLTKTKRVLYVEGIAGNIDSGEWEKLGHGERLEGFDHVFVWRVEPDIVVGRLWSSRDGKGRARYPMVVCAHCHGVPLDWAAETAGVELERLKASCIATGAAEEVQTAVESVQRELSAAAALTRADPDAGGGNGNSKQRTEADHAVLSLLGKRPEFGPEGEGFVRIMYAIQRDMGAFRPATGSGTRIGRDEARAQQIRVPRCGKAALEGVVEWLRAMRTQLHPAAPVLAAAPVAGAWVDLIVGDPGVRHLFAIRASQEKIPLTSDVPYTIEPQFLRDVQEMIGR